MASFDGRLAEALVQAIGDHGMNESDVLSALVQTFADGRIEPEIDVQSVVSDAIEAAIGEMPDEEYAAVVHRLQDRVMDEMTRQAKEIALRMMRGVLEGQAVAAS